MLGVLWLTHFKKFKLAREMPVGQLEESYTKPDRDEGQKQMK